MFSDDVFAGREAFVDQLGADLYEHLGQEGFGLTETAPGVSILDADHVKGEGGFDRAGSIPGRDTDVDVNDRDVPTGEVSGLIAGGPNVFLSGYWRLPEAVRGGWFHTGDTGRTDSEGFMPRYRRGELSQPLIPGRHPRRPVRREHRTRRGFRRRDRTRPLSAPPPFLRSARRPIEFAPRQSSFWSSTNHIQAHYSATDCTRDVMFIPTLTATFTTTALDNNRTATNRWRPRPVTPPMAAHHTTLFDLRFAISQVEGAIK